jgi:hypothetical protein
LEQIATDSKNKKDQSTRIDALHWLSRATLDIIGLAGFNYDFNTISTGDEGNEMAHAFHKMNNPGGLPVLMFMKGLFKALRIIVSRRLFSFILHPSPFTLRETKILIH